MTLRPETEISVIRRHIAELKAQPWLDPARQWWPDCLFHCTDISNVASILNQGELVSRKQIAGSGLVSVDIASPEIIARTEPQWQDYVRLYFRPKTPTQYHNEGFRPIGQRSRNSHCPVPVYLIFNALEVLSRADSCCSDGNLGSSYSRVHKDLSFLKLIPFESVYHNTWLDSSDGGREIIRLRHAEVMVPQRMTLDGLQSIVCRSDAEYRTLLHLLPPEICSFWVSRIGVLSGLQLFHREWTFVDQVDMTSETIVFRFNPSSRPTGPFHARVEIDETATGIKYHWQNQSLQCNQDLTLSLSRLQSPSEYVVRLSLDDQLAFANRYQEYDDLPF